MDSLNQRVAESGRWLLAAAFLATPLTTLRLTGSLAFGDFFLALALGIAVILVITSRRLPKIPMWLWVGGGILLVSIAAVQLFPPDSLDQLVDSFLPTPYGSSLEAGIRLMVALIVVPVAAGIIVNRWSTIDLLVNAWIIGVSISCAVAVIDAYTGFGIQTSLADDAKQAATFLASQPARYIGLTGHPNTLGLTAAMSSPLVIAKMTSPRRVIEFLPVLILLLFGVLLSGSRAALVGIAVATVLTLVLNPRIRRAVFCREPRVLVTLVAGGVMTVALLFLVPVHSYSTVTTTHDGGKPATVSRANPFESSAQESDSIRQKYFNDSIEYIKERPVPGYGFQWIESSHNLYLQLLLSGGILALIGYLVVMLGYLKEGLGLRTRVPESIREISVGVTVSIAVFLIMGLVSTDVLDRYLYLPAALILSMSLMQGAGDANESQRSEA